MVQIRCVVLYCYLHPPLPILSGLYYSTPLRLDVYKNGVVIFPNNAEIIDGKYTLKPKDPGLPDDQVSDSLGLSILGLQIGWS